MTYPCRAPDVPGDEIVFGDGFPMPNGRGRLVPVGDPGAMARAIADTLDAPPPRDLFVDRARHYSYDGVLLDYDRVLTQAAAALLRASRGVVVNLVDIHAIPREDQDQFALESHRRAVAARGEGRFAEGHREDHPGEGASAGRLRKPAEQQPAV